MFCCCVYLADDFSVDNLAGDYTVVSGSWAVSGGKLTASAAGVLLANPTSGSNHHTHVVRVTMHTAGDVVKVLAGYLDADNHLFVELTQSASRVTAKLFKRVAGVNTQILPTRFHYSALGIGVFPGGFSSSLYAPVPTSRRQCSMVSRASSLTTLCRWDPVADWKLPASAAQSTLTI